MTEKRKAYKKAYQKAYYKAHEEEFKEYRQAHKEEINAKAKAYNKSHREYYLRKYYCINLEEVENYEEAKADNFIKWDIHHRLETHTLDGIRRSVNITSKELMKLGMYYNRPASELIFMTHSEHRSLHNMKKR